MTADDLTPNELREIVGNASTDRRNVLFAASDNPHRDNEPPPIKQEVADDDGGKIRPSADRDLGGIPAFVRVCQDSPTRQTPFDSSVLPPPSDSDGSRFSDSSESFDDLSVNALCSGDAPPAPMAVDTQGPYESHDAPHVAPPRRQSARLNGDSMHRGNAARQLAEVKHEFGLRVEALGWMAFDARVARDIRLSDVDTTRGNYVTHHKMVIARDFQTEMETAHVHSHLLGKEYKKAVAAHLDPDDVAAHEWVRNSRDTFPMILIEEKFGKNHG